MLDEIEAQDRTGFLSWLRSGADRATHPTVDEFRRKAAQDKLADDSYSAQIEPRRVCRRLFSLSHATMADPSACAW
jgi:hypothetical protein